ncbi:MAG: Gfo/Idh/MocA family oxidoreductase [Candidatus Glassbacteria bacterium]|nr:Gfo/Idh/MocA family oxidoreductase [Candidatus Glassbacteria bacterium]
MKRRDFLGRAAAAAGAGVLSSGAAGRARSSRNDEITMAVVGIRGQGTSHLRCFNAFDGVRIKTICEVDENLYKQSAEFAAGLGAGDVRFEHDFRRVLDDKDIDAVSIATPEQWHSLMTIWACQAGKDVYVEKPVSHNIWEGRQAVNAARKYGRIVASGTQQRSFPHVIEAMKLLREGVIGDVFLSRGLCFKPRESIGKKPDARVPAGVHYDLWLGPAPLRPFSENRFHYNWHWFWDYGCGDIGNQGVHEIDTARWGLGKTTLPSKVYSSGGYWAFDSDQETPNTQSTTFTWDDGKQLQFEVRGLYTNAEHETRIGNLFYGTEGWMNLDIDGFQTWLGRGDEPGPSREAVVISEEAGIGGPQGFTETGAHTSSRIMHRRNFIDAVRSRKSTDLGADILEGHLSSSLCHLANISYRLGRELSFDSHSERFIGDSQADGYLTRNYRYPYVVPEKV